MYNFPEELRKIISIRIDPQVWKAAREKPEYQSDLRTGLETSSSR